MCLVVIFVVEFGIKIYLVKLYKKVFSDKFISDVLFLCLSFIILNLLKKIDI